MKIILPVGILYRKNRYVLIKEKVNFFNMEKNDIVTVLSIRTPFMLKEVLQEWSC